MKRKESIHQQAHLLIGSPILQAELLALRKRFDIPPEGLMSEGALENWNEQHIYNKFDAAQPMENAVTKLIRKHGLEVGWHHSFMRYLLLNDRDDMELPTELQIGVFPDETTGNPQLHLIITADTTIEDVKAIWPRVKKAQDRLPYKKKQKRRPISEENLKWGELSLAMERDGKSDTEIAEEFTDQAEKANPDGFKSYNAEDVRTIRRNYKKQTGIY